MSEPLRTPAWEDEAASVAVPAPAPASATVVRSAGDQRMRRLLLLPTDAAPVKLIDAHGVVSRSIAVSAARCTLTYIVAPLIGPIAGLRGTAAPLLGIVLSLLSFVALTAGVRRFFAADHRWRWKYAALAAALTVFVAVQLVADVGSLLT